MNRFKLSCIILIALMCVKSTSSKDKNQTGTIEIEWELISNLSTSHPGAQARFIFQNKGNTTLGPSGWTLYFNMAPRNIMPAGDTSKADIIHINGDWYKLVPRNTFSLLPGESITVSYNFEGWAIKECDAPAGLYFAFCNDKGEESEIVPVSNYTIRPFTREEQIRRSTEDCEPLPTPENRYYKYQKLQAIKNTGLLPLIPSPVSIDFYDDSLTLDANYSISYDAQLISEARFLSEKLKNIAGLELDLRNIPDPSLPKIHLKYKKSGGPDEAYQLSVNRNGITISGEPAGVFYGIQSLLKLIPYDVYKTKPGTVRLPALEITDAPRFAYRGQHIDVCRNFQSKEQLLKIIDLMAFYKLNTLHLYLTEDEAWRLEIAGLPELTGYASRRGHDPDEKEFLHPSYGSGPFPDAADNHGTGYYSRDDFKEIIRFAHERHIRVIPGINFPGHARAAIKAMEARYKRLMAEGKETEANEFRLIDPGDRSEYLSAQYYNDNVVCVARESVYHFYETVIDDIIAMYHEAGVPLEMIFTGGDEVPEGAWTQSPMCDSLLQKLPRIKDPKNLQQYFFKRIVAIINERNLKAGGWEEVVLTKKEDWTYDVNPEFVNSNVIPYVWNNLNGSQDLAYRIANAGYTVVMCPVSNFYFDLAYSNDPVEPGLYWSGFINEQSAWECSPYNLLLSTTHDAMGRKINTPTEYAHMERLHKDAISNILGLQAQLWHETIRGGQMMEYYLLPKLIAFSERCWSGAPEWENIENRDERQKIMHPEWQQFSNSIYLQELPKLSFLNGGYNYRIPPAGAIIENGYLKAMAVSPELEIRYTNDGSEPDQHSPVYENPVKVGGTVKLRVFDKAGRTSRSSSIGKQEGEL